MLFLRRKVLLQAADQKQARLQPSSNIDTDDSATVSFYIRISATRDFLHEEHCNALCHLLTFIFCCVNYFCSTNKALLMLLTDVGGK